MDPCSVVIYARSTVGDITTKVSPDAKQRILPQTRTLGITTITELILFVVRCPKNVISEEINGKDRGTPGISKIIRPEGKVTRLKRIHERYPD